MPAPSALPLINAAALAIAIVSITISWWLVGVGADHLPRHDGSLDPRRQARHRRAPARPLTPLALRPRRLRAREGGWDQRRAGAGGRVRGRLRGLPERSRRARAGRGVRPRPPGGRGAAERARPRRGPPRGGPARARRRRQPAEAHAAGGRRLPAREPLDLRERAPRLQRGPRGRADRARARRAAARAGRRVGGAQLLADRRGDPPAHGRRRALADRRHARHGRRSSRPTRGCGR